MEDGQNLRHFAKNTEVQSDSNQCGVTTLRGIVRLDGWASVSGAVSIIYRWLSRLDTIWIFVTLHINRIQTMKLDALVIAPHPDDAELGMAGGILKMLASGWQVGVLDLTNGEPTPHGSIEIRSAETKAATEVLGLSWRDNLGLPNRSLEATLEARKKLASVIRTVQPRWLFAPFWLDAHPDHVAATQLVDAARFWAKLSNTDMPGEPFHPERIYNYYCVHLKMHATPAFVLDISDVWEQKMESIRCYHSQFIKGREHLDPQFIDQLRDEAAYWGKSIGVKYGEPYTSREPIGLTDFSSLN